MKPAAAADQTQTPKLLLLTIGNLQDLNGCTIRPVCMALRVKCQIYVSVLPKHGIGNVNFAKRVVIQSTNDCLIDERFGRGFVLSFQCRI